MKFDFIIGNPPYEEEVENNGRKSPIYNYFMNESYKVGNVVELITPARFLFDAGQTPKAWNKKMLNDEHFKTLQYFMDASSVFPNTDIKGGVVISIHDNQKEYGKIGTFAAYDELNIIKEKIINYNKNYTDLFLDSIVSSRGNYRLTSQFFTDFSDEVTRLGAGTGNMVVSNIFEKIPEAFLEEISSYEVKDYIRLLGRIKNERVYRYVKKIYIIENEYINSYNVLLPEANGTGKLGEVLSTPLISDPFTGATDTFISIGACETKDEATSCLNYIKTKFARTLLGVLKITQHNPKSVWSYVPLQDFTPNSDINWSKSIPEIDQQLYAKYGLNDDEIAFIESHVKEMS